MTPELEELEFHALILTPTREFAFQWPFEGRHFGYWRVGGGHEAHITPMFRDCDCYAWAVVRTGADRKLPTGQERGHFDEPKQMLVMLIRSRKMGTSKSNVKKKQAKARDEKRHQCQN